MARVGARGRGKSKAARIKAPKGPKAGKSTTINTSPGATWKPAKPATGTAPYGKAVSAAAHARNAQRKSPTPVPVATTPAARPGTYRTLPVGPARIISPMGKPMTPASVQPSDVGPGKRRKMPRSR